MQLKTDYNVNYNDNRGETGMTEIIKAKPKVQKDKERYSTDFLIVRRAVFQNFIAHKTHIKEEDLTLHHVNMIIYDVGKYFSEKNVAGLTKLPDIDDTLDNKSIYGGER